MPPILPTQQDQILDLIREIKIAVLGDNGNREVPGLVSDMRDVCTRLEAVETKVDTLTMTGCRFGQTTHTTPHPRDRQDDKMTTKWMLEKVVSVLINWVPWVAAGTLWIKYITSTKP